MEYETLTETQIAKTRDIYHCTKERRGKKGSFQFIALLYRFLPVVFCWRFNVPTLSPKQTIICAKNKRVKNLFAISRCWMGPWFEKRFYNKRTRLLGLLLFFLMVASFASARVTLRVPLGPSEMLLLHVYMLVLSNKHLVFIIWNVLFE